MQIEKVHLYVEKYNRNEKELWLDFIQEDEFFYFREMGDYTSSMHLSTPLYNPSMLLVHNCFPMKRLHEGMIITIHMSNLMKFRMQHTEISEEDGQQVSHRPALVFLEIDNGNLFAQMIDAESTLVSEHTPKEFMRSLRPSWDGCPCALENLGDNFELRIWNVGQGNTNSISDKTNLTLFDFGASMYYSYSDLRKIIQDHKNIITGIDRISLIISHWDCDHFNLLLASDDCFLKNICCVFYPPTVTTLTAKQVAARIEANCPYRVVIAPAKQVIAHKCGLQKVCSSSEYTLFTGENSQDKNLSGLLLVVHNDTCTAILAADHSNYQVWNIVYSHISKDKTLHIVVPHHGGYCGRTAVQVSTYPGVAAVSVGSNSYGHPRSKIIAEYRAAHYHVQRTDHTNQDIVIPFW